MVWITVDKGEVDPAQLRGRSSRLPEGVAVDAEGNAIVTLSETGPDGEYLTRRIDGEALFTLDEEPCPPAPPELADRSRTHLTVRWECDDDTNLIDAHELWFKRAEAPDSAFELLAAASRFETCEHRLDGLAPNDRFEFRVRRENPLGWSEFSLSSAPMATRADVPDAPRAPFSSLITPDMIVLHWRPPELNGAPLERFELQRKHAGTDWADEYAGVSNQHVLTGLPEATKVYFRVRCLNAEGASGWSLTSTFLTGAAGEDGVAEDVPDGALRRKEDWLECWDDATQAVFYFNKYTSERVLEKPPEFLESDGVSPSSSGESEDDGEDGEEKDEGDDQEKKEKQREQDNPAMAFRKKRFRFLMGVRMGAPQELLHLKLRRSHALEDSFKQFQRLTARNDLRRKTKVEFEGEPGIDSGGVTRDWYALLSRTMFTADSGLFVSSPQGFVEINPQPTRPEAYYKFVGRVLAKAVFDRQLMGLRFAGAMFKHLLGREVGLADLAELDPALHKGLSWMLENDITDVIYESFSVPAPGDPQTQIGLVEDGAEREVTEENKEEYVQLMVQWRTTFSVKAQLDALVAGFRTLLPQESLEPFSLDEFRLLLCGRPDIDVDEIRAYVIFQGGYGPRSPQVVWLWKALREFSVEQRGLFLRFVTGSDKVPLDGYDPPFNLTKATDAPDALPRAHTCFSQLVMPPYESYEQLVDKLRMAMENTEGFALT